MLEHQKDEVLDRLAGHGNVAQFIALRPTQNGIAQSYSRIRGHKPNSPFESPSHAISALLRSSHSRMVNVRSYVPHDPRSQEFVYGLRNVDETLAAVHRLAAAGLHLIVNETIDVSDGGVSGVVQGGMIEFSPDDTPRCVEKPGVASLPFEVGMELLTLVYGFRPDVEARSGLRTEFSIHPLKQGWRSTHTILWEQEEGVLGETVPAQRWPNRFSRHIGDKAYGLIMAHIAGLPVPRTLVIPRRVAPFSFGEATGSAEVWTRTCPFEPQPGLYTTIKGWTDPYTLLGNEDPTGKVLASALRQDAVPAHHSGAAIVQGDGKLAIEGLEGEGDQFMLGSKVAAKLPDDVIRDVRDVFLSLEHRFGPVRFEWVHDGERAWLVQLHLGATKSTAAEIVPGEALHWTDFRTEDGLEKLRSLLTGLPADGGIRVIGQVGLTSHIADVLRRAGFPARVPTDA